ncbi:MAG: phosphodiester glycosidase family protein, partial [Leptolyngbyaceae cyanobacterium bins.59]|nr:phosphodiester glycosidase family protein [Leptolyngbyaceae cyanobacterium bins.59]
TTEFLQRFRLKLAINASFFFPFHERHPLDFYPRSGERVEVLGQVIANGVEYSKPRGGWAVLCILKNRQVQIPNRLECPPETLQGVAGSLVLINQGKPQPIDPAILRQDKPNPRTAVGIDRSGKKMWWVLIDGRQPFYSEGVYLQELVTILQDQGIDTALALDGGGSTTLVMADENGPRLLNSPIHTRIPLRQRYLANHLGIDAQPIAK